MSWTLSVVSAGSEYDLSDNVNYLLAGIDGIAAAPVARITERGPMQHGESDFGFRLQPRRISLALLDWGGDTAAWFARREEIMRIFRSTNEPIQLRIAWDNQVRQVDCYLIGMMEMPPAVGLVPGWQKVGIELIAPDPTFYDPVGVTVTFALGGGGTLSVPLSVPMQVGSSVIDQSIPIYYTGTWDAFPIITARGPITDLLVQNNSLGDKLDFTGTTIAAGDQYIIDCRYGRKMVTRQSDGANRVQDLSADSNLATFRIGAHPNPPGGINSIRVKASGLTSGSCIYIQFNSRYVGV